MVFDTRKLGTSEFLSRESVIEILGGKRISLFLSVYYSLESSDRRKLIRIKQPLPNKYTFQLKRNDTRYATQIPSVRTARKRPTHDSSLYRRAISFAVHEKAVYIPLRHTDIVFSALAAQ